MEKIVGNIYVTNDYSQFKTLGGNRIIDHSDKIVESIEKNGQLFAPILVNEKSEIIDGQNRFEACKKLKLPIYYMVARGYGINECIAMNSVSKNWSTMDYIQSYANLGNEDYIVLKRLLDKYSGQLPNSVIIAMVSGNIDFVSQKAIRNGAFKLGSSNVEYVDNILQYLSKFNVTKIHGNSGLLYKIIAFCYITDEIDNDKLISFFNKYHYTIESVVDTKQASEAIEKIYNFKCNKSNYVFISLMYQKFALKIQATNQYTKEKDTLKKRSKGNMQIEATNADIWC